MSNTYCHSCLRGQNQYRPDELVFSSYWNDVSVVAAVAVAAAASVAAAVLVAAAVSVVAALSKEGINEIHYCYKSAYQQSKIAWVFFQGTVKMK